MRRPGLMVNVMLTLEMGEESYEPKNADGF
jgi:hypothetical protein